MRWIVFFLVLSMTVVALWNWWAYPFVYSYGLFGGTLGIVTVFAMMLATILLILTALWRWAKNAG
jgi:uncharacterized membrane protein